MITLYTACVFNSSETSRNMYKYPGDDLLANIFKVYFYFCYLSLFLIVKNSLLSNKLLVNAYLTLFYLSIQYKIEYVDTHLIYASQISLISYKDLTKANPYYYNSYILTPYY